MDNMQIWNSVEKTDPMYTKKVNQRGGFTAIDAQYQIKKATEIFGPVGVGWGYECGDPIFKDELILVPVTMWHTDRKNTFGPIYGAAQIGGKRTNPEAPKSAMTDAITKGLSHIGFNADVFLGKFEDSKYVEKNRREFEEADHPFDSQKAFDWFLVQIRGAPNGNALDKWWNSSKIKGYFEKLEPEHQSEVIKAHSDRMAEFPEREAA